MFKMKCLFLIVLFSSVGFNYLLAQTCKEKRLNKKVEKRLVNWRKEKIGLDQYMAIKVDSFKLKQGDHKLRVYFAPDLSFLPFREENTGKLYSSLQKDLGRKFKNYNLTIISNKSDIRDLVPNWARKQFPIDAQRNTTPQGKRIPLVRKLDGTVPTRGLYNNNLALWGSHGYYFESSLDRWEYQRAKLFGTVEDLLPTSYILQYLVPMLENAGAEVFMPRERDTQTHEVIVDNDNPVKGQFIFPSGLMFQVIEKGFMPKDTIFPLDKPFESGTSARLDPEIFAGRQVQYIPDIPERGRYAVYISYLRNDSNATGVEYIVRHLGGDTRFLVNQRMGGSCWVYLGTFDFGNGINPASGAVVLNIKGSEDGFVSTDAVRFGGGMGNVARRPLDNGKVNYSWKLSGKPRYVEGARYYLQYNGAPDSLTFNLNKGKNDYTDDLQGRGEWINYLVGNSKPQYRSSFNRGQNIPIDLSLAWHTDASYAGNDSVVGTLVLYSTEKNNGIYPNGQSKMTNRDLADLVQTQIVDDIQKQYKSDWTRRAMWNRGFSEAYRQVVPAMLLELLSHQNLNDMRYSQDPRFRFTVSRAVYKGILKYLAYQDNRSYVVQPLPVDHFSVTALGGKSIRLSWSPVSDSLEPTAKPLKYKIYKRIADGGFDNGVVVSDTSTLTTLENFDQIYSFKITALNDGGESFPSEILSVGIKDEKAPLALVVNKFNRVSAPAFFDNGTMAGLAAWDDQGVPDKAEIGYIGSQYDFDKKSVWKDDDSPGLGASYENFAGKVIPGNTFDFSYTHGAALLANGYSFVSVSDEVFTQKAFDIKPYGVVDVILGKEKTTPSLRNKSIKDFQIYTPSFCNKLNELAANGKGIFLSGAYTASDLLNTGDSTAIKFVRDVFHFQWRTNHAASTGVVYATDEASAGFKGNWTFNTGYDPSIYTVEAPDALEPDGGNASTIFRYKENNSSAGVGYKGKFSSVVCGFPFETIKTSHERKDFMAQVLNFLKNK
jgi:hypothetical protein